MTPIGQFLKIKDVDKNKILLNEGTKIICENCQERCFDTSYCEHCVRNCLKTKFLYCTSENKDIDNLIRNCQMEAYAPYKIVEWIPYNNLRNVQSLTKGGCSKIYTADWIDGPFIEWDNQEQRLKRSGMQEVILKKLENVESANQRWFEEVCNNKEV